MFFKGTKKRIKYLIFKFIMKQINIIGLEKKTSDQIISNLLENGKNFIKKPKSFYNKK